MLITKVQSDRGFIATLVFFALSSMTDLPRSAASCENGRLSNKEVIACVTSARSHVTSAKLAKKCVQGKPILSRLQWTIIDRNVLWNLRPCPVPTACIYNTHTGRYIGVYVHVNHIWFSTVILTKNCPGFEVKWHYVWGSMISTVTNSIQYQVWVSL